MLLRLPATGGVIGLENERFPDPDYWDVLAARAGALAIDGNASRALSDFQMTDWEHIDWEEAPRFTQRLLEILPPDC